MINMPAELGWISKNLPLSPRALGQDFTDPPLLCWQVYSRLTLQELKWMDKKTKARTQTKAYLITAHREYSEEIGNDLELGKTSYLKTPSG